MKKEKTTLKKDTIKSDDLEDSRKELTKKIFGMFAESLIQEKINSGKFMVIVEDKLYPPTLFHESYDEALTEAIRLATKENKKAYVVKVMAAVEITHNVTKY
jgi:hypothetical protein